MKCRPDDLCILVKNSTGLSCYDGLIGLPLTVDVVVAADPYLGAIWRIKGQAPKCPNRGCNGVVSSFLDADLQPIRPPGVDVAAPRVEETPEVARG